MKKKVVKNLQGMKEIDKVYTLNKMATKVRKSRAGTFLQVC